ncbi:cytochrome P450 4d2 [Zeugodacus cucurbitae]|uniref:Cytochrome P450 4d2 n=1 Tax=Zeugodacus cucurbitae TaxID=28588 RepID=A0A0A1X817_ZEUCU|nr:cytochrome P450 4d2 [Zeugodacus cucurbitae]
MFIELLLLLFALIILGDYLLKKRRNDMIHYMPGPKTLPVLGNALMYHGKSKADIMDFIISNSQKYGTLYRVWVLNQLAVLCCDPADVEVLLSSTKYIKKNNFYDLLHVWLGAGLLVSNGHKWHSRRKIITPTFHFKILEQFVEIYDQQSAVLVKKLEQYADGKTVLNIAPLICLMALDVIAETAMGTKINAQTNPQLPYVSAVISVTDMFAKRFIHAWQRFDWLFRLFSRKEAKLFYANIELLHDFTDHIIVERRAALEQKLTANEPATETELGVKRRMALLDVLLQSTIDGKPLSNEDIREEVDTFMFEGHDTTSNALTFCLHLISRHPMVQAKLFEEIRDVLGDDKERPVTQRDLIELKYMECVIKESLRLYPTVPLIGRNFEEDVNLRGKMIPAGTNITVGIYIMQRNPKYFPEPDAFRPERFLNESVEGGEKLNPYIYVPFSAGPRNCIGQKFAMLEMKSTISKILRHFELLPLGEELRPVLSIVLRSENGGQLGLKPRNYAATNTI